jgi:hypothetical protein
MSTVLKIALGVGLTIAVMFVGCGVLVGAGFNAVEKSLDKHSITQAQFDSVKSGARGNTRKRILARFGEPQTMTEINDGPPPADCMYYNRKGEFLSVYEICFDTRDRVRSKSLL